VPSDDPQEPQPAGLYDFSAFQTPAAASMRPASGSARWRVGSAIGDRTPYAPWLRRVGALVVDYVLAVTVQFFGTLALAWFILAPGASESEVRQTGAVAGVAVQGILLVALLLMQGWLGATPGKMLLGIQVVRDDSGGPLGFWRTVWRQICHLADLAPLGLGYLLPLWDTKHQTFADKAVRSVVVLSR
jgi:uncharacterized RDD family membrane protein YckC